MKTAKHDLMHTTNTLMVLNHIRMHGPSTKRDVQTGTSLSWGTVSNISSELLEKQVLCEAYSTGHTVGRIPANLDFKELTNLTVGVDITVNGLTAVLLDLRCRVIRQMQQPLVSLECSDVQAQAANLISALLQAEHLTSGNLLGIGVSMQGSVSKDGELSIFAPFFLHWKNVPLAQFLRRKFGVPVHVMHDPNCIALAEQWIGAARNVVEDFLLLRVSSGIGMSCVNGGEVRLGENGTAGEVGHLVIDPNGPLCSCGGRGCLEAYASQRGILERVQKLSGREISLDYARIGESMHRTAQAARDGDALLQTVFAEAGRALGIGIADLVNLLNPSLIILAGEMMPFCDLFWDPMLETARERAWRFSPVNIVVSALPVSSSAIGAAIYFIKRAFSGESRVLLQPAAKP